MSLLLGFVNRKMRLAYGTYKAGKMSTRGGEEDRRAEASRRVGAGLAPPNRTPMACARTQCARKYHARQGGESHPQAETPVQDQSNVMPNGQRRAIRGVRPFNGQVVSECPVIQASQQQCPENSDGLESEIAI